MKNKSLLLTLILLCSAQGLMGMDKQPQPNQFDLAECKKIAETSNQTDTKKSQEKNTSNTESTVDVLKRLIPVEDLYGIIFNQAKEWQDETESAMTFNDAQRLVELDNSFVAVSKTDGTTEIWDTKKKKLTKTLQDTGYLQHSHNKLMYTLNDNTMVYDIDNDTYETLPGDDAEFLENGFIFTNVESDDALKVWDLSLPKDKRCVATLPLIHEEEKENKESMENEIGQQTCQHVFALSNGNFAYHNHKTLRVIDPKKTSKEQIIKEITVQDVMSPYEDRIAIQKNDTEFSIYNLVTLQEEAQLNGNFLELLPDNRIFLTLDGQLYLWDTKITDKNKQQTIFGQFAGMRNDILVTRYERTANSLEDPLLIEYMWDVSQTIPVAIAGVPTKAGEILEHELIDDNIVIFDMNGQTIKIINPNNNQTVATVSLPQNPGTYYQVQVLDNGSIMTQHDESHTIRLWEPTKACSLEEAYIKQKAVEKAKKQ